MFSIEIIEPGRLLGRGRLRIGGFEEEFETSLEYWSATDYERQWTTALERVLAHCRPAALITSLTDPARSNFLTWWPMYPAAENIVFQNALLFLDQLPAPFDPMCWERFVPPRERYTEEGEQLSEWHTSAAAIRKFLAHRQR